MTLPSQETSYKTLQNSHIRFSSKWRKNSGELKILPSLKPKVPVCLWLELCTLICWGTSQRAVISAVTTRGKGHSSPGDESLWERRMTGGRRNVLTLSQELQCSTFASERPQVRTQERQTCFLPRTPSNFVGPLTVIKYSLALSMYMKWRVTQWRSYVGHNSLS